MKTPVQLSILLALLLALGGCLNDNNNDNSNAENNNNPLPTKTSKTWDHMAWNKSTWSGR